MTRLLVTVHREPGEWRDRHRPDWRVDPELERAEWHDHHVDVFLEAPFGTTATDLLAERGHWLVAFSGWVTTATDIDVPLTAAQLVSLVEAQGVGVLFDLAGEYLIFALHRPSRRWWLVRDATGIQSGLHAERGGVVVFGTSAGDVATAAAQHDRHVEQALALGARMGRHRYATAQIVTDAPSVLGVLPVAHANQVAGSGAEAELLVHVSDVPVPCTGGPVRALFEVGSSPDVAVEFEILARADGWELSGAGLRCHLDPAMRLLTVTPEPGAPLETVRHLLLDQVLPYVLALRGEVVLHASGTVIDGAGVAFLGPSGMGKSTLATALGQRGHPVLTDDCAVVHWESDRLLIEPSYPGLRLWPASVENLLADDDAELTPMAHYSTKVRAVPESVTFAEEAVPFAGALVITNSPEDTPGLVAITPLSPGAAAFEMIESAFVLAEGPEDKAAIFDRFTTLAAAVPVVRVTVPNDFSRLPAVCDAVEAWARSPER